jgi:hypothetical protein
MSNVAAIDKYRAFVKEGGKCDSCSCNTRTVFGEKPFSQDGVALAHTKKQCGIQMKHTAAFQNRFDMLDTSSRYKRNLINDAVLLATSKGTNILNRSSFNTALLLQE